MAGFAKGMATTSGWALVRCDCRTQIQDRASMDRSRAMKMAAAAGNGDEQDRIEGSIAHDPADGIDSFSFRVTNCSSLLRMQLSTEPPGSEGAMDGVQRLSSSMTTARTTIGATVSQHYMFRRGFVWKCEHVRWTPCRFSPPGALSAPKGEWPYTEATPSGAAPTSPPKGVFRHKRRMELVELSGRTTGRLGYTWPTKDYAIGGTAMLALRYSIISASTAARTRPQ